MTDSKQVRKNMKEKVVIAGGGLVGALAACTFADSGHEGKGLEVC